jgi:aminopeptidase N
MKMRIVFGLLLMSTWVFQKAQAQHTCSHRSSDRDLYPNTENLRSDTFDILNYALHLDITDFSGRTISGEATITWLPKLANVNTIPFDLLGFNIQNVEVNQQNATYAYNDSLLRIQLPQSYPVGDTQQITIRYSGSPAIDQSGWGGFYFSGGYAFNLGVGFDAKPHNYGRAWYPCFDNFKERATYSMFIETQPNHRGSSMGEFIDSTVTANNTIVWHYEMAEPIPTYLSMCAVSNYAVVDDVHQGLQRQIPMELYANPGDTGAMKSSFIHLKDAIHAFETGYGPYQWNKVGYTVVPFNAGAMEHASNITYPRNAINGTLNSESLMAHELAHSWWGNLVTCETPEDMWLNEGWASYSSYLFFERIYDWNRAVEEMKSTLKPVIQKAHLDEGGYLAVSGLPHSLTYGTHTYDKGSLVAWNLRAYLGDSAFFSGIASFMQIHAFSNMNSMEFRDDLSAITGVDLTHFFNDWVFNGGYPAFEVNQWTSTDNATGAKDVSVEIEQKLRGTSSYFRNVPLEIRLMANDGTFKDFVTVVDSQLTTVNLSVDFEPYQILLNPQNKLALAVTDAKQTITGTGNYDFSDAMVATFSVNNLQDSGSIHIKHYWVAPDPIKDFNTKPYRLSDYRYWEIAGDENAGIQAEAVLFYDGNQGNGFLDSSLVSVTEDSLVLLFRSGPQDDWVEYPHYTKNTLGNSNNALGVMNLSQVLFGEYTFANIDHKVLSTEDVQNDTQGLLLYPNPSSGQVRIESVAQKNIKSVRVYAMNGAEIKPRISLNGSQAMVNELSSGSYVFHVLEENGELRLVKHVVK